MAYDPISTAEVAVGKPVRPVMVKAKGNFDYLYGAISSLGGNLPVNGSFEIDADEDGIPDSWSRTLYSGGSGGLYTAAPAHGARAAYFTHPGGAGNGGGYLDSDYIEASQLQILALYYITWATAAGMKNQIYVRYYTAAKAYISETALYSSTSNPTSPTLYCSQFTPPSTARYCKIRVIGGYTDTNVAGTAYFDGFWLVPAVITEQIVNGEIIEALLGAGSVSQSKLKTSSGSISKAPGASGHLALPGGAYGFHIQQYSSSNTLGTSNSRITLLDGSYAAVLGTTPVTQIYINNGDTDTTIYVKQTYVTSSGEVFWILILRDKLTKKIISVYESPDHPCFGQGGKPLLMPHPFKADYDPDKHEIIVINPDEAQLAEMRAKCEVDDETKPDREMGLIIAEDYEIDEDSNPEWPDKEVTVGLPKGTEWKQMPEGTPVIPIKKKIPKPAYIMTRSLRKKK